MQRTTSSSTQTLKKKLQQTEARLKRVLADYYNLEQRIAREKDQIIKFANETLLLKLLRLKDDLERATVLLKDKGLELILHNLNHLLSSEHVHEIKAHGQPFDPHTMEAVEKTKGPQNKVIEVVQKGYFLHDRVLRPAKVKVGSGHESEKSRKELKKTTH